MEKLCKFLSTFSFCALFAGFFSALGADEIEERDLDSIVSTATRTPTLMSEAPGNTNVLGAKKIKQQATKQLSDILNRQAGIRTEGGISYNGRPHINMRGIPFGTLVMLDGVILNDLEGEFRIIQSLNSNDIDRIEIVRGAFSSLYGAGGIGGLINVVTKSPTKRQSVAQIGYGNEIIRNGSEKNLVKGYFSIGDVFLDSRFRVRASYGFSSSDGFYGQPATAILPAGASNVSATFTDGRAIQDGDRVGWIGRTGYLTQSANLKVEYDWNDTHTTSLSMIYTGILANQNNPISYLRNSADGSTTYAYTYATNTNTKNFYNPFIGSGMAGGFREQHNIIASLAHKIYLSENNHLDISLASVNLINHWADGCYGADVCKTGQYGDALANAQHSYVFGGEGYSQDNVASSNYLSLIYTHQFSKKHSLLFGIQGRVMIAQTQDHYASDYATRNFYNTYYFKYKEDNASAYTLASFVNWQAKWNAYLSTNLGVRLDYWKNFNMSTFDRTASDPSTDYFKGNEQFFPSPKFAINYNPWKYTTFKSSVGLAFHTPSTRQMFAHGGVGTYQDSNVHLKPEYGLQFDIGVEQRNAYGGMIQVYYYQTEMFDVIYQAGRGRIDDPYRNQNGSRARFNGVEVELNQKIYGDFSIGANYTYTRAVLLKNSQNPSTNGNQMPNIPYHMGGFSLNYGGGSGFFGSLSMQGMSGAYNSIDNKPIEFKMGSITPRLIFDLKLGYEFKNESFLSVSFYNFTNTQYYDYYRGPGASFFVNFGAKLF